MLDRAGITGDDGPSHNGMWDMALLRHVPGLRLAAPRDEPTLRAAFREAVEVNDAPTVVRYPKGPVGEDMPAVKRVDDVDVLAVHGSGAPQVVVFGLGSMASTAVEAAGKIAAEGLSVVAATATWVHPLPEGLLEVMDGAPLVVTIEDGLVDAGIGEEWANFARLAGATSAWRHHGIPREFLEHASRAQIVEAVGLDAGAIADDALGQVR